MIPVNLHPSRALVSSQIELPIIPSCEHFAGSERFVLKAFNLQQSSPAAFDVTCDCEDGSQVGQEASQRDMFITLVRERAKNICRGRVGVRVHEITSRHFSDDIQSFGAHLSGLVSYVVLPKARHAEDVRNAAAALAKAFTSPPPRLHVLIETTGALRDLPLIAALPGIETLDFGIMDFIAELQGAIPDDAIRSPLQFEHPLVREVKVRLALAALGCGIVPSHNVTLDFSSGEPAFLDASRARREFGFLRMWSIHPVQIEAITRAFQPTFAEVEKASAVLLGGVKAEWAPTRYGTELHDRASYRIYWRLLAHAFQNGVPLSEEVLRTFFA